MENSISLRPSAAKTWTTCTAQPWAVKAAQSEGRIVERIADYTEAGSKAHALAEVALRRNADPMVLAAELAVPEEEALAVSTYVRYVRTTAGADTVAIETKVALPWGYDGTIDAAILHSEDAPVLLDIVDYKHGEGVGVSSDSIQLRIYAAGYLNMLAEDGLLTLCQVLDHKVRLHIVQPRHRDYEGVVPYETTVRALLDELDGIADIAGEIQAAGGVENLKFHPSEDGCQFCPLGGLCYARSKAGLAALPETTGGAVLSAGAPVRIPDPETLTDEQIARVIELSPMLSKWLDKVESMAAARLLAGKEIPGLKVVAGRSNRKWTSDTDASKLLLNYLPTADIYVKKLVSPAQAEELLAGKELSTKFKNKFEALITRDGGKPKVVLASDKRAALQPPKPAEQVFSPESPVVSADDDI